MPRPGAQICYQHPATVEWGTPQDFFDALHKEFDFTVDVAASEENAKCVRYWGYADEPLAKDWTQERCWMNPPYGREIQYWMRKAYETGRDGGLAVCLVPARTDTKWWWDYAMKGQVRFVRGRLRFTGGSPQNPLSHNAPFPVAVVIFDGRSGSLPEPTMGPA
jgi:phage N-6-adenine-methyltransferase